jgi:hypothetical protein
MYGNGHTGNGNYSLSKLAKSMASEDTEADPFLQSGQAISWSRWIVGLDFDNDGLHR